MLRTSVLCAILSLSVIGGGCATFRNIIKDEGPSFSRTATSVSMHLWLKKSNVDKAKAAEYKTYILEARALVAQGEVPATVLDEIAKRLNEKIDNDIVRAVIQQGIETIKTRVVLPSSGLLPESAKVWVFAVLDGAVDGINLYLSEATLPQGTVGATPEKSVISFR
jgi:hypothetical protein